MIPASADPEVVHRNALQRLSPLPRMLNGAAERLFYWLGFVHGVSPLSSIVIYLMGTALLSTGVIFLTLDDHPTLLKMFAEEDCPLRTVPYPEHLFPQDDLLHLKILITSDYDIFNTQTLRFMSDLDALVKNVTVGSLAWEDMCARPGMSVSASFHHRGSRPGFDSLSSPTEDFQSPETLGPCLERTILQWFAGYDLHSISQAQIFRVLEDIRTRKYPVPDVVSRIPRMDALTGSIGGAEATVMEYFIKDNSRTKDWQLAVQMKLDEMRSAAPFGTKFMYWTPHDEVNGLKEASSHDPVLITTVFLLSAGYMILTLDGHVFRRFWSTITGVACVTLTVLSGWGFSGYYNKTVLNPLYPLLPIISWMVAGIPMIFLVTRVWRSTKPLKPKDAGGQAPMGFSRTERCGLTFKALVFVSLPTSLVLIYGFCSLQFQHAIPTLESLGIFGAIAMGLIVPFVLSLSVSMLAMMSKTSLVMADHDSTCWKRMTAVPARSFSLSARLEQLFCPSALGISRFSLDAFFGFLVPTAMSKIIFRIFVLMATIGIMGINLWSCFHLNEDTDFMTMLPNDCKSMIYKRNFREAFPHEPSVTLYLGQMTNPDQSSSPLQKLSRGIKINVSEVQVESIRFWYDSYQDWLRAGPREYYLSSEPLDSYGRFFLNSIQGRSFLVDIRGAFRNEGSMISGSKLKFSHYNMKRNEDRMNAYYSTLTIARLFYEHSGIPVAVESGRYLEWTVTDAIQKSWIPLIAGTSSIAVILALGILGLRPAWFWGMTSLTCSVVDTLGTSAFLGIPIDFSAPFVWIMALSLGLIPVMFVAQVLTATMTQRKDLKYLGLSLSFVGPPVLHSFITVLIAGSCCVLWNHSHLTSNCMKVLVIIAFYVALHSLVFLPTMMVWSTTVDREEQLLKNILQNGDLYSLTAVNCLNGKEHIPEEWPEFTLRKNSAWKRDRPNRNSSTRARMFARNPRFQAQAMPPLSRHDSLRHTRRPPTLSRSASSREYVSRAAKLSAQGNEGLRRAASERDVARSYRQRERDPSLVKNVNPNDLRRNMAAHGGGRQPVRKIAGQNILVNGGRRTSCSEQVTTRRPSVDASGHGQRHRRASSPSSRMVDRDLTAHVNARSTYFFGREDMHQLGLAKTDDKYEVLAKLQGPSGNEDDASVMRQTPYDNAPPLPARPRNRRPSGPQGSMLMSLSSRTTEMDADSIARSSQTSASDNLGTDETARASGRPEGVPLAALVKNSRKMAAEEMGDSIALLSFSQRALID